MLESRARDVPLFARTTPLPLLRSKETRFDSDFPSCLIDISAVIGPLVVCRVRFLRSSPEEVPGDGGGGDKERSRMKCPSSGTPVFDIQR